VPPSAVPQNIKSTCIYTLISTILNPRNTTDCLPKETRFVYPLHLLLYSKLHSSLLLHTHANNTLTSCYSNSSTIVCDLCKLLVGYRYGTVCGLWQSGRRHLKWSRLSVFCLNHQTLTIMNETLEAVTERMCQNCYTVCTFASW
jgi:hypothetical protein